mgnify:CR=1 FL=1
MTITDGGVYVLTGAHANGNVTVSGGSFAITNPEPVFLKAVEYQEMISALRKELGL